MKMAKGLLLPAMLLLNITTVTLQAKLNALTYTTSWIGNTFGGANDKYVQISANNIFVSTDGTVFTNSTWDEAGHEAGVYKNGDYLGRFNDLHGWARSGGLTVTATANYVYLGMKQAYQSGQTTGYPPSGTTWYCVRRYNRSTYAPAPFTGGSGWDGSMLIVNTTGQVTGLAVYNNELYVSDPSGSGAIRVYDATTMAAKRSWTVATPGQLAFDPSGYLWVIQGTGLKRYSTTGVLQSQQITGIAEPTALCITSAGNLLVADNGPNQQVRIYTNISTSPTFSSTLGTTGGIFAGTTTKGTTGALRFNGLTGVGVDSSGNQYVSCNGWGPSTTKDGFGLDLRSLSPTGALNWQLFGLEFVDGADVDPNANTHLWTQHEHMVIGYNRTTPGSEWTYPGFTLDRFTYPNDPRLHVAPHPASTMVRRFGGQLFLFVTDQQAGFIEVFRFKSSVSGEIAIPCALFSRNTSSIEGGTWPPNQLTTGAWLWRDNNANGQFDAGEFQSQSADTINMYGWWVDATGNVWKAMRNTGIRKYACTGIDANGVPSWQTTAASTYWAKPAPFDGTGGDLRRIQYDSATNTDSLYLSGYSDAYPNTTNQWGPAGKILVRYDYWNTSRVIHSGYPIVLPYNETDNNISTPKSFSVAGDYIFVVNTANAKVTVYNKETAALVGTMSPGPEVGGTSGWVDIMEGIRAYKLGTGEYVVFVEEDLRGKILMYRWTP